MDNPVRTGVSEEGIKMTKTRKRFRKSLLYKKTMR